MYIRGLYEEIYSCMLTHSQTRQGSNHRPIVENKIMIFWIVKQVGCTVLDPEFWFRNCFTILTRVHTTSSWAVAQEVEQVVH